MIDQFRFILFLDKIKLNDVISDYELQKEDMSLEEIENIFKKISVNLFEIFKSNYPEIKVRLDMDNADYSNLSNLVKDFKSKEDLRILFEGFFLINKNHLFDLADEYYSELNI